MSVEMSAAGPDHAGFGTETENAKGRERDALVDVDVHVAGAQKQGEELDNQAPTAKMSMTRIVVASVVGNVLEWFDFGVFAFLAPTIGQHTWTSHDVQ